MYDIFLRVFMRLKGEPYLHVRVCPSSKLARNYLCCTSIERKYTVCISMISVQTMVQIVSREAENTYASIARAMSI